MLEEIINKNLNRIEKDLLEIKDLQTTVFQIYENIVITELQRNEIDKKCINEYRSV